ncbi:hypothetical protein LTS18_006658 [Coniosporium uncinatum]|uniref:Uncharacterized protein n=1 Tax=Coniosporium uncinatum TaxID=93489 RepID=A0ACC3DPW8_9PEZI|nr:hypothetical protein LTS18_006658 [Coniosporium uncinatum]
MPVLLDVDGSDSEDEVVAIGTGQFRRKSPGTGKEWMNEEINGSGDDKKLANGTRQNGNKRRRADIKPENILLQPNETAEYEDFPVPLLADFGKAWVTRSTDEQNPNACIGRGTPSYMAPEQVANVVSGTKILSHTNVYGVGVVLWRLMHGRTHRHPPYPAWVRLRQRSDTDELLLTDELPSDDTKYSRTLDRLVQYCLFEDPKRRSRIPSLKRWIHAAAKQAKLVPQRGTWPAAFAGSAQGYRERFKGFNTEK